MEDITRGEAMKKAGYSDQMSRYPAQVERSEGFKLASMQVAGDTGRAYIKILGELKLRDMSKESTDTLLKAVDTLSKAWERFIPKQQAQGPDDLSGIFDNIINITPSVDESGLDNKEDMLDNIDINTTHIVEDVNAIDHELDNASNDVV